MAMMTSHAHSLPTPPSVCDVAPHHPSHAKVAPLGHLRGLLPNCPTPQHHSWCHNTTCMTLAPENKCVPSLRSPPFSCMQVKGGTSPSLRLRWPYLEQYLMDSSHSKSHEHVEACRGRLGRARIEKAPVSALSPAKACW